ncbi:MAG: heme ABC transporter permease CcmC [Candidatus Methylomirabilales bacterium]
MGKGVGALAILLLAFGLYLAFFYAPPDAIQGNVQRIMYLHVPSILTAYLAFFVVFVGSFLYLIRRKTWWDRLAHSSAELGVLFTGIAIATGSIWGKPTWGVWWTWDARLTTTAILLVIYIGYLMLRAFVEDPERGARYAAVLGIVGFLDVPLIHLSVVWWRTLHQPSSMLRPGGPSIAPPMLFALSLNVFAYIFLYLYLLKERMRLAELQALARERARLNAAP